MSTKINNLIARKYAIGLLYILIVNLTIMYILMNAFRDNSSVINSLPFFFLLGLYIPWYIMHRNRVKYFGKYMTCPNCKKSMLIYDRWRCNSCHNIQIKEKYIFDHCEHCRQNQLSFHCEYCDEELVRRQFPEIR